MGDGSGRALERVRFWIIVLTVLALVVPMVISYRRLYRNPPSLYLVRAQGERAPVLERFKSERTVSVFVGLAARELAGDDLERIRVPVPFRFLADRESDTFQGQERPALNPFYVRHSSGSLLVSSEYDSVLTAQEVADLRSDAEFIEYPWDVIVVAGDTDDRGVVLYTDEDRHSIYVIPESMEPLR